MQRWQERNGVLVKHQPTAQELLSEAIQMLNEWEPGAMISPQVTMLTARDTIQEALELLDGDSTTGNGTTPTKESI